MTLEERNARASRFVAGLELEQGRRIRVELLNGSSVIGEVDCIALTEDIQPVAIRLWVTPMKAVWDHVDLLRDPPDDAAEDRQVKRYVEAGDRYLRKILWHAITTWRDAQ